MLFQLDRFCSDNSLFVCQIGRGRWGNMGTLRNSVHQRLSSNKKVLLLVLNATLDLCLSIANVVFLARSCNAFLRDA